MAEKEKDAKLDLEKPKTLTCGLIMPISPIDGCTAEHWADVKMIIKESIEGIENPKFVTSIVSDANDVGVIQKRIVKGVYESDIVVCDVSGRNSNVMFELGMRLAFDKPTVIIKDDKTDYSFDVNIIEHLAYPRDLRFSQIVAFKKHLADKVLATYEASEKDPNHSTFLKNFGTFKISHLKQKEGSSEDLIFEMLQEIREDISSLKNVINFTAARAKQSQNELRISNDQFSIKDEPFIKVVNALTKLQKERGIKHLDHISAVKNIHELIIKYDPSISYDFTSPKQLDAAIELALRTLKI